jgi:hypothetical protein
LFKNVEIGNWLIVALGKGHNTVLELFGNLVAARQTALVAKPPALGSYIITTMHAIKHS